MPSLMDMPEIVMNKVLELSNVREIQILRKVCHHLRNYIDDAKPDSNALDIEIFVSPGKIRVTYDRLTNNCAEYQESQLGCLLKHQKKETFLENGDFRKIAIQDLNSILKNQKSAFYTFWILSGRETNTGFRENTWIPLLEAIGNILKSRVQPLKTNHFYMDPINQQEVLMILPFVDSKPLEKIMFYKCSPVEGPLDILEVDEISKSEQWRNAKILHSELYMELENFAEGYGHFESVRITLKTVSPEKLLMLKTAFISSPNLQTLMIHCETLSYDDLIPFGEPLFNEDPVHEQAFWYFHIPGSNLIMQMNCPRRLQFINFEKIERGNVLDNAIIRM